MKRQLLFTLVFIIASCCLHAGCSVFGGSFAAEMRERQEKILEYRYFTSLHIGNVGIMGVESGKKEVIADRQWNFAEIWGLAFEQKMKERGYPISGLVPTKGGQYTLDDLGDKPVFGGVYAGGRQTVIQFSMRNPNVRYKIRSSETIQTEKLDGTTLTDEEAYEAIFALFLVQADKAVDILIAECKKNEIELF